LNLKSEIRNPIPIDIGTEICNPQSAIFFLLINESANTKSAIRNPQSAIFFLLINEFANPESEISNQLINESANQNLTTCQLPELFTFYFLLEFPLPTALCLLPTDL
jgi:hypothetical protein